jgi:hypothetical protein
MNAKTFHQIYTAQQNIQLEMFKFTDKLITALGERCMFCRICGFADCPLWDSSPQPGTFSCSSPWTDFPVFPHGQIWMFYPHPCFLIPCVVLSFFS